MKVNLIILFFILPVICIGQNSLTGKYCNEPNMFVKCFTFNEDGLFEYYFKGDLRPYEVRGNGTYAMKENVLSLHFENDDTLKSMYSLKDLMESHGDSIVLSFLVVDKKTLEPIPFADIFIETNNCEYKASSDFEGNASAKILRSQERYTFTLDYVSYKSFSTEIKIEKSKEFTIYLSSTNGLIQNGTIWKYVVLENDSLSLKLEDLRNGNINKLLKYKL